MNASRIKRQPWPRGSCKSPGAGEKLVPWGIWQQATVFWEVGRDQDCRALKVLLGIVNYILRASKLLKTFKVRGNRGRSALWGTNYLWWSVFYWMDWRGKSEEKHANLCKRQYLETVEAEIFSFGSIVELTMSCWAVCFELTAVPLYLSGSSPP